MLGMKSKEERADAKAKKVFKDWELAEGPIDEIAQLIIEYVQCNSLVGTKCMEAKNYYFGEDAEEMLITIIQFKAMAKAMNKILQFQSKD